MSEFAARLTRAGIENDDRVAIAWDGGHLTYAALREQVSDLVVDLEKLVGPCPPGARIAVDAARSASTVVAYVTCVQQGWVYVPIPDGSPRQRAEAILRSADPVARLTPTQIGAAHRLTMVRAIDDSDGVDDDVVALLHTSGSTGTPKGVTITGRNLAAFVDWCSQQLPMRAGDRVAALSPFHFDLCTHDIYATLLQGGTLVLPDEVTEFSPQRCLKFLEDHRISRLYMVPTFLERLCRAAVRRGTRLSGIDTVMFAGERLSGAARPLLEQTFPEAALWNLYGPIETNVITAARLERGAAHDSSDIGEALPGVVLRVRDQDGALLSEGRGELLAAGPSVSPGYLDRAGENNARFTVAGQLRFYATGDEVTLDSSGRVTLHGRLDNMVKIRGLRVELEEVEAVIAAVPEVRAVGVVPAADHLSLVAFLQADDPSTALPAVRLACRERLADYMAPSRWDFVPEMPTTPSGKVDRQSLRRREESATHGEPVRHHP
ncbi:AMP-binding protein [Actinoplanes philippinensis]|uniref:AMP-binding protein n=1 Tax=Actinoplanes philippinensis TaxID=35752 RepID=UPI00340A9457